MITSRKEQENQVEYENRLLKHAMIQLMVYASVSQLDINYPKEKLFGSIGHVLNAAGELELYIAKVDVK